VTTDELWSEAKEIESLSKLLSKIETMCDSERTRTLRMKVMDALYGKEIVDNKDEGITPSVINPFEELYLHAISERDKIAEEAQVLHETIYEVGLMLQKCRPVESKILLERIGIRL
jgi:hypothetical protein